MPRNVAGVPIDPTEYNRNDGFSPGNPVTTNVSTVAQGHPAAPVNEVPNDQGVDPHGPDASEGPAGQAQIGTWLNGGGLIDPCGNAPC